MATNSRNRLYYPSHVDKTSDCNIMLVQSHSPKVQVSKFLCMSHIKLQVGRLKNLVHIAARSGIPIAVVSIQHISGPRLPALQKNFQPMQYIPSHCHIGRHEGSEFHPSMSLGTKNKMNATVREYWLTQFTHLQAGKIDENPGT